FLELYTVDETLYWVLPLRASSEKLELMWTRYGERPWRLRRSGQTFWRETTCDNLVGALDQENVDSDACQEAMRQSVLQQAIFAHRIYQEAVNLMGDETVSQAIAHNEAFLIELTSTI